MTHTTLPHDVPRGFDKEAARTHLFQGSGCCRRWENSPPCSSPAEMCTSDDNPDTCVTSEFVSSSSVLDSSIAPSFHSVNDKDEG
jgi:hypothetical protein